MLYLVPSHHSLLGEIDPWTCANRSYGCRSQARFAYPYTSPFSLPNSCNYIGHAESHKPRQPRVPRWKIARHQDGLVLHVNLSTFPSQNHDVRVTLEKGNVLRVRILRNQEKDVFEMFLGVLHSDVVVFEQDFRLESDINVKEISAFHEGNVLKINLPYIQKPTQNTHSRRIVIDGPATSRSKVDEALPSVRKDAKGKEALDGPVPYEAGPSSITFNDWAAIDKVDEVNTNEHHQRESSTEVEEFTVGRNGKEEVTRLSDDEDGSIEDCEY